MSSFGSLTYQSQMIITVIVSIITIGYIYILIDFIIGKRKPGYITLVAIPCALGYLGIQSFSSYFRLYYDNDYLPDFDKMVAHKLSATTVITVILAIIIMMCCFAFEFLMVVRYYRNSITEQSVKNGLDMLPAGIMYFWGNGIVKLINIRMEEICRSFEKNVSFDGKTFWTKLYNEEYDLLKYVPPKSENSVTVLIADKCYHFMRNEIKINDNKMFEIIAIDVTDENAINKKLTKDREKIKELNLRLKMLSENIGRMTIEREILDTKINVHDSLGEALLLVKQYLTDTDTMNRYDAVSLLKRNISLLENERPDNWQSSYEECIKVAALSEVQVIIEGSLPKVEKVRHVVETAITTCVTNVVRHAKGKHLYVKVKQTEKYYYISVTNDGIVPKDNIIESGGLKNLRILVENNCGEMNISINPEFCIELKLEKWDGK